VPQHFYLLDILVNIYIYIYKSKSKHTRQRSAVATRSFTPVGDLQATDISNLLQAHINKGDISVPDDHERPFKEHSQ